MNKIEKYYTEEGIDKVIISEDTAKELKLVIKGFEAGQMQACGAVNMTDLGHYIAEEYLDEESTKASLKYWPEFESLARTVKDKIKELLP